MRKRPDWSHPLPQPLSIPGIMDLVTLADVRELLRHLPGGGISSQGNLALCHHETQCRRTRRPRDRCRRTAAHGAVDGGHYVSAPVKSCGARCSMSAIFCRIRHGQTLIFQPLRRKAVASIYPTDAMRRRAVDRAVGRPANPESAPPLGQRSESGAFVYVR